MHVDGAELDRDALTRLWAARWPKTRPIGHELRGAYRDQWVRFHSLPGSQRYAENESEYEVLLNRHHLVLGELAEGSSGSRLLLITCSWSTEPGAVERATPLARLDPGAVLWQTLENDDNDPGSPLWVHVQVSLVEPGRETLDPILRVVADDRTRGLILADQQLGWLYHPYDGGADVLTLRSAERDVLAARHGDWLPSNRWGL
jgi:hypothetical protein